MSESQDPGEETTPQVGVGPAGVEHGSNGPTIVSRLDTEDDVEHKLLKQIRDSVAQLICDHHTSTRELVELRERTRDRERIVLRLRQLLIDLVDLRDHFTFANNRLSQAAQADEPDPNTDGYARRLLNDLCEQLDTILACQGIVPHEPTMGEEVDLSHFQIGDKREIDQKLDTVIEPHRPAYRWSNDPAFGGRETLLRKGVVVVSAGGTNDEISTD